jgi:hypothetical protein
MESENRLWNRVLNASGLLWNGSSPRKKAAYAVVALTTVAISVMATALIFPSVTRAQDGDEITTSEDREFKTLTIDVGQIGSTNAQNDVDPSEGHSTFTRGDAFILDGNIYPNGTLPRGKAHNDPNAPGIGKYTIRATTTGDPSTVPTVAFATELFLLPDDGTSILTDGLWPNEGFSAHRVVLGGTGRFRYSIGEVYEENLGLNKDGFCNLRVTFRLRKALARHDR